MADDFDNRLGKMFAQAPAFGDSDAFARRVTERLDRAWAMRRTMIGVGGLTAGVVVAWQFMAGRFGGELSNVSTSARTALDAGIGGALSGFNQVVAMPAGGETLWFAAALGAAALALAVTRAVESY